MELYYTHKHMYCGSPRRRRKRGYLKKKWLKASQIWWKMKDSSQIQDAQQIVSRINLKKSTLRNIIINQKTKARRILKAARERWLIRYKLSSIRLSADFRLRDQGTVGWCTQSTEKKNPKLSVIILYVAKLLSFENEG